MEGSHKEVNKLWIREADTLPLTSAAWGRGIREPIRLREEGCCDQSTTTTKDAEPGQGLANGDLHAECTPPATHLWEPQPEKTQSLQERASQVGHCPSAVQASYGFLVGMPYWL